MVYANFAYTTSFVLHVLHGQSLNDVLTIRCSYYAIMPASKERSKKKGAYAFKEGELDRDSVYAENAYTASDGKIYVLHG